MISEVPGYMKRTEIAGWDDPEQVRIGVLYDTDIMPFERSLAPAKNSKRPLYRSSPFETEMVSTIRTGGCPPTRPRYSCGGWTRRAAVDLQHVGTIRARNQSRHGARVD